MVSQLFCLCSSSPGTFSHSLFLELCFRGKNNVSMALTKSKELVSVPWNVIEPLDFYMARKLGCIVLIRTLEASGNGLKEKEKVG